MLPKVQLSQRSSAITKLLKNQKLNHQSLPKIKNYNHKFKIVRKSIRIRKSAFNVKKDSLKEVMDFVFLPLPIANFTRETFVFFVKNHRPSSKTNVNLIVDFSVRKTYIIVFKHSYHHDNLYFIIIHHKLLYNPMFIFVQKLTAILLFQFCEIDKLSMQSEIFQRLKTKVQHRCHHDFGYIVQVISMTDPKFNTSSLPTVENSYCELTVEFSAICFKRICGDIQL